MTRLARLATDQALYAALFVFLAGQTAAGSAQHAHDAFVQGGQDRPGWLPWTLAGTPELLAILATLEYRHRRKTYGADADVRVPVAFIVGSVLVLMGAQLVTAQHTVLGVFAAAWPALAFLAALTLIETRPRAAAVPAVKPKRKPAEKPAPDQGGGTGSDGDPDGIPGDMPAGVAARLAGLSPNARAVYGVLADADGKLTPAEIRERTGLTKDTTYKAVKALLAAELAHATTDPVGYAVRRLEVA